MLIRLPATRRSAAMAHCRRWYRARSCRRLRLGAPARASAGTAAAPVEPAQGRRPGAREALDRLLAASAVDVLVGNLPHPPPEMRFQRRPADERVTGDRIAFDVTDAALVFSLGARSVWSTGPRPEIPVMRKGGEPLVGADLARRRGRPARALSNNPSRVIPPKWRNAASMPSNHADCRSWRS